VNQKVKSLLLIALKNAVNAVLTNAGLMASMSNTFNLHDWAGTKHILLATGSVILSRESMVWGPKLLKWSMTDAVPNGNSATSADKPTSSYSDLGR
jgi:hypothetical protein